MKSHQEILNQLLNDKLVAILRADSGELLVEASRAMVRGGIRSLEITMTVPGAIEILKQAREQLDDEVLVGAGTVLDAETARLVILAGADFIVSPHTDPEVIQMARRYSKPVLPGAFTPTEVVQAWQMGADIVKIFPSDPIGPKYIKNLRGPLPQIRLMPTGGVDLDTIGDFFAAGACAVGIGSSLLKKNWLNEENFDAIETEARKFVEAIQ